MNDGQFVQVMSFVNACQTLLIRIVIFIKCKVQWSYFNTLSSRPFPLEGSTLDDEIYSGLSDQIE